MQGENHNWPENSFRVFEFDAFSHFGSLDYIKRQNKKRLFYPNVKHDFDFEYHSNQATDGSRSFLAREVLNFADRMRGGGERVVELNRTSGELRRESSDWDSVAHQLQKSVNASIQAKLTASLTNSEDALSAKRFAHVLGMHIEPNALPHNIQNVLDDKTYSVRLDDYDRAGMSLVWSGSSLAPEKEENKPKNGAEVGQAAVLKAAVFPGSGTNSDVIDRAAKIGSNMLPYSTDALSFGKEDRYPKYYENSAVFREKTVNNPSLPVQTENSLLHKMTSTEDVNFDFLAEKVHVNPVLHQGQTARDRAVLRAGKAAMTPIWLRERKAVEQLPWTGECNTTESGMNAGYSTHPQVGSPRAIERSVGGAGYSAATHNMARTIDMDAQRSPHSEVAQSKTTRALSLGQSEEQAGAKLDRASFAAFRGSPYLAVAATTSLSRSGRAVRAATTQLPNWMISGTVGEVGAGATMAPEKDRAPSWALPAWIRPGEDEGTTKSLMRVSPMQTSPAALGNVSTTRAALATSDGALSSAGQDRAGSFTFPPSTQAVWAGSARGEGQVSMADDATLASSDAVEDARRQVLDEMTRLASRPPAGVTGFDAGQMPAWLGGWTGSA